MSHPVIQRLSPTKVPMSTKLVCKNPIHYRPVRITHRDFLTKNGINTQTPMHRKRAITGRAMNEKIGRCTSLLQNLDNKRDPGYYCNSITSRAVALAVLKHPVSASKQTLCNCFSLLVVKSLEESTGL